MPNIVFISNFFNHHQRFLCDSLKENCHGSFHFIETIEIDLDRRQLGWGESLYPEYVIKFYENDAERKRSTDLINNADIIIIGSAPDSIIRNALRKGKIVFRYSERPLKKGLEPTKYLFRLFKWHIANKHKYNVFLLSASAYAAKDFAKFGLFKNKSFKWGYFPRTIEYDNINTEVSKKSDFSLLWVGRFLDWKHPEIAVQVAKKLKDEGYVFHLEMIGTGPLLEKIKQQVKDFHLEHCVSILGAMTPDKVRQHMEKSKVFIFTSDKQEGWGAVLNEAMNSGCAVVANKEIGSAPFLIENDMNGFLFDGFQDLYKKIVLLLTNEQKCKNFGIEGYNTITKVWNADLAAKRFVDLSNSLLQKTDLPNFPNGPCSSIKE